jgi:hypothetical protein
LHQLDTVEGEELVRQATTKPPFGPGFSADEVARATKMESWGSSFSDPGDDFCLFKLFDSAGTLLGERRTEGF